MISRRLKNIKKQFLVCALIVLGGISLTGQACTRSGEQSTNTNINLIVWGLWHDSQMIDPINAAYEEATGVHVTYKKIASVAEYEKELLEALAEGRGPDIFVIHHTWVDDKKGLMTPAPDTIIDTRALKEEFVDVVSQDLVRENQIYALPTSVDTLALYYNRDLLASAGIAQPPRTWTQFQQSVEQLTNVNRFGSIIQSGATLGTAGNVARAADILQALMLQSGVEFPGVSSEEGQRSLVFYTDFSNKEKSVFTWNLQQPYSVDAFAEGLAAMMIGYSYNVPTIEAKNPRLRFDISNLPQIADGQTTNFASYWPFTVSRQSQASTAAWQYIRHITSTDISSRLNEARRVPPARRDLVDSLRRDPEIGVFAEQTLTAVSWPRIDIVAIDAIFNTMIDSVVTGASTIAESTIRAQDQLQQLIADQELEREEQNKPQNRPPSLNIL